MTNLRTKNTYQKKVYDFIQYIYIICPHCQNKAIIQTDRVTLTDINEHKIKLICTSCGYNKYLEEKSTNRR
jgi:transcription elongation factor Elf1